MKFVEMGAIMLVYLFLFTIVFFIISAPLTIIFDSLGDTTGEHSDEMDEHLPNIRTALNIFFALVIATPIVGFIVWVYHREPDWGIRRY